MTWDGKVVPDHNRSELSFEYEIIEKKQRMWDGTLRKYHIASKRIFSVSWDMLPTRRDETVGSDQVMDAIHIDRFYDTHKGPFVLQLYYGGGKDGVHQKPVRRPQSVANEGEGSEYEEHGGRYLVMFSDYSKSIVSRGSVDYWNISASLEEC